MFCDGHGHASGFGRLRAFGAGLFALEVSGASLAFFDFIVLLAHGLESLERVKRGLDENFGVGEFAERGSGSNRFTKR